MLSTVFEISRWSIHYCCSTVATSIQWPGCRLEQRGNLVRYQTGARGFSLAKSMKTETGIQKQFYSVGPGIKQSGGVADNQQQQSPKMKDGPAVTGLNVHIATVVRDSCDVRYSGTLNCSILCESCWNLRCAMSLCWHILTYLLHGAESFLRS
jgi:hypothetical protein